MENGWEFEGLVKLDWNLCLSQGDKVGYYKSKANLVAMLELKSIDMMHLWMTVYIRSLIFSAEVNKLRPQPVFLVVLGSEKVLA